MRFCIGFNDDGSLFHNLPIRILYLIFHYIFLILFIDRASQHRSKKLQEYLIENKDSLRIVYLPKSSPQSNAVEECWRQGQYDLLVSKYYSRFTDLKSTIFRYYRTRRFNLDIAKFLLRND